MLSNIFFITSFLIFITSPVSASNDLKIDDSQGTLKLNQLDITLNRIEKFLYTDSTVQLTQIEILDFFRSLYANTTSNTKLRKNYIKTTLSPQQRDLLDFMIDFSYKTTLKIDKIESKLNNFRHDHQRILWSDADKISVTELRTIVSMKHSYELAQKSSLAPLIRVIAQDEHIFDYLNFCQIANDFYQVLYQKVSQGNQSVGLSLISYDFANDFAFRKWSKSKVKFIHRLSGVLGVSTEHISLSFTNQNTQYESQMWGKPSTFKLTTIPLQSYLYKTYDIRISRILSHEDHEEGGPSQNKLLLLYGANWERIINSKLSHISFDFFSDQSSKDRLIHLYNPYLRRIGSVFRSPYGMNQRSLIDQIEFSHKRKATCAEFVFKSYLMILTKLNEVLAKDWFNSKLHESQPPPKIPTLLHPKLRIKYMTPQQVINFFRKKNIVEARPYNKHLMRYIKFKQFE